MSLYAVDTSVAVAALDPRQNAQAACRAICSEHRPVLSGHACLKTYSVLTRLPGSAVVTPQVVGRLLSQGAGTTITIEGFPLASDTRRSGGSDYMTGDESLFKNAGFEPTTRPSNARVIMRRTLT